MHNTNKYQHLLNWYDLNKRILPWRKTNDPYMIWLSEVMLQQTQVSVVIPYYNDWIEKYPTVQSVAEANLDELLKFWEGLGYYSRCRNFHQASKYVVTNFGGVVPDQYDLFISLPGVGKYIASAVMSIAYNHKYPAIDGNLKRVLSRYLRIRKISKRNLVKIENKLKIMINERPGDINQALMDIGSLICKPTTVFCSLCPLETSCKGTSSYDPTQYPERQKRKKIPTKHYVSGYISEGKHILIQKRPSEGLLAGLWELPVVERNKKSDSISIFEKYTKESLGCKIEKINKIGTIKHTYSHYKIKITLIECQPTNINVKNSKWIKIDEINNYTFSKANHKIFNTIGIIND